MITREMLTGAIKLCKVAGFKDPKKTIAEMLRKDGHKEKDVKKVLEDLDSYPDWSALNA